MSAFVGMNVEEVQRIATQLHTKAEAIRSLSNEINALLSNLDANWKGSDAVQFKGQWEQQHRPRLQELGNAVEELSRTARSNAAEQAQATGH